MISVILVNVYFDGDAVTGCFFVVVLDGVG
jgi:hypothetical protein